MQNSVYKSAIKRYVMKFYLEDRISESTVKTLFKIYRLKKW